MAQLIELSDDDDDEIFEISVPNKPKKSQSVFRCLNPDCKSVSDLVKASVNIRRFYGVETYHKKTRICHKCLNNAQSERDAIGNLLRSGTNLLSKEICLSRKIVVLEDSDSDKTDDELSSEESEYELEFDGNVSSKYTNNIDSNEELRGVVLDIMSEIDLSKHMVDGKNIIDERLKEAEKGFSELNLEYIQIEKKIDKLRNDFYNSFKLDIKLLPPLEIGPLEMLTQSLETAEVIAEPLVSNIGFNLPPIGPLVRPPVKVNDEVYLMKHTKVSKWICATVVDVKAPPDPKETFYMVQFSKDSDGKELLQKLTNGKNLAYFSQCPTRIPVGTRIIAKFDEDDVNSFYIGIIAENPTGANKYRYLIFFDDGYAQYVIHSDIRIVIQSSTQVWEDVAPKSKEFIKDYLQTYPEKPMVRLSMYNYIKTEHGGKWWRAQVLEVDNSLVKMYFPVLEKTEWIYRGSTRLSPLFDKKISMKIKSENPNKIIRRRTMPVNRCGPIVEYINFEDEEKKSRESTIPVEAPVQKEKRAVARKSSASKTNVISLIPIKDQLVLESEGFYTSVKQSSSSFKFSRHQCSFNCISETDAVLNSKTKSPLIKPILLGWKRQVSSEKKKRFIKKVCNYTAPCGRRLRSLEEIWMYLRQTKSKLQMDYFAFDTEISLPRTWEPSNKHYFMEDITQGKEDVQISCVNSIKNEEPKPLVYSSIRIPSEHVLLNLDTRYLVCCSCEDDCKDKSRCECWQLTLEAAKSHPQAGNKDIGFKYRRLYDQVLTGIFECNSQCSCKKSCLNRLVQFPIRQKLQLFKTAKRGWGVRTLHDLPKGSFICVYVGRVLTETEANDEGMTDGADDYYANLDFIEVVEGMKEGYESEAENIESEDESKDTATKSSSNNSDVDEQHLNVDSTGTNSSRKRRNKTYWDSEFNCKISKGVQLGARNRSTRLLSKTGNPKKPNESEDIQLQVKSVSNGNHSESEDSSNSLDRRPQTFEPCEDTSGLMGLKLSLSSVRELYSVEESVYVMDAKLTGNVGRYLNHSCNPNMFVQNVFVDTHDPRFPWISFFAAINIKAGMELTWDYNYEVGSVPGKIKYCYCRSDNCRGRLL